MSETATIPMQITVPFDEILVEDASKPCSRIEIRRVARQIRAIGVLEPLVVYRNKEDRLVLISGLRRYLAIQMLREDEPRDFLVVPVTVVGTEYVEQLKEIESARNAS